MGKFVVGVVGAYVLYYAVNILYDLFLKKEKTTEAENNEQDYSLGEVAKQNTVVPINVGIEDVENIRTPQSYESTDDVFLSAKEDEQPDLEKLKSKYEDETDFYGNNAEEKKEEKKKEEPIQNKKPSIVDRAISSVDINELLQKANTRVKMVANYDGQKVYHLHA